ncbi:MAG: helix-turn-helix domain-containing protein [Desulfobacterales bacterium]|nr:helix-turn-helix domain-containing protein [Desulfobacterales bacterium]
MNEVGEKLKSLRLLNDITLQELSETSGVSKSLLSQIERGASVPTVSRLQKIAEAFGLSMSAFFAEVEAKANGDNGSGKRNTDLPAAVFREEVKPIIVRKNQRKKLITPWGATMEMLCPDLQHKLELIYLHYPVGSKAENTYAHQGEECGHIIKGCLKGRIGDEDITLEAGDSVYYASTIPHQWYNDGDSEVVAIWAVTPPSF